MKIRGTKRDDDLVGTSDADLISMLSGEDEVHGGGGDDVIGGEVYLRGGTPDGGRVVDTDANIGDQFAVVGGDRLYGDSGNDIIYVGYDSYADGGAGVDTAVIDLDTMYVHGVGNSIQTTFNDEGADVDLAASTATIGIGGLGDMSMTLVDFERFQIIFGSGDDRAFGAALDDTLDGGFGGSDEFHGRGGDDALHGVGGADRLFGDEGNDILDGNSSNNFVVDDGATDRLSGGVGDDILFAARGDLIDGGDGYDWAAITLAGSAMSYRINLDALVGTGGVNLRDGDSDPAFVHEGTRISGIENLLTFTLGSGDDMVVGSQRAFAGIDPDYPYGMRGLDLGSGNDAFRLTGAWNSGVATVSGGVGNDRLVLDGEFIDPITLRAFAIAGFETIVLTAGHDFTIAVGFASGAKRIDGSALALGDVLHATNTTADRLTMLGGDGDDLLTGGSRGDVLRGGDGNDALTGGRGGDTLTGGMGADSFVFTNTSDSRTLSGADRIIDFDTDQGDTIDLSAIDAIRRGRADAAFTFIGESAFSNRAGELRTYVEAGITVVTGDVTGDGQGDFYLTLDGALVLSAGAFVL